MGVTNPCINIHIFWKIDISKQSNGGVNQHKMEAPADFLLTGEIPFISIWWSSPSTQIWLSMRENVE